MGHVKCIKKIRNVHTILVGKPEGKTGVDGRIILKYI
jgi:hypothetical protein